MAIYGNIENVDAVLLATVTAEAIHIKGADGKDGASITISNISESAADGGTNTVTFSDGSALNVKNGSKGSAGANGKSAYQYAVEGGYTGTETEFAEKLASGALIVTITDNNGTLSADKTYIEIGDAIASGIPVLVDYGGTSLPLIVADAVSLWFGAIECANDEYGAAVGTNIIEITSTDEVHDISAQINIPKTLPNPQAITFTGAVTGSYDGSAPLSVNIPTVPAKTSQLTNDSGYLTLATLPKYGGESV